MALPLSGEISMYDIQVELGIGEGDPGFFDFGLDQARSGVYVTINTCSTYKPPSSGPISLSDWYGYDQTQSCGPTYDFYLADEYSCNPCTLQNTNVPVCFPSGTGVYYNRYYNDLSFDGFVYRLQSTNSYTTSLILTTTGSGTNCNTVCSV
jgi:hypothetical protein